MEAAQERKSAAGLSESQQNCLSMIQSVYGDPIDGIAEPVINEDGDIECEFVDGKKRLLATIYPDRDENDIAIKMLNPDEI